MGLVELPMPDEHNERSQHCASLHQDQPVGNGKRRTGCLQTERRSGVTWRSPKIREDQGDGVAIVASHLMTMRSATGGQTQETMVDTDVSGDHRGSRVEKTLASGEPGAWKSCMPVFGGGPLEKDWCKPVPRWRPILPRLNVKVCNVMHRKSCAYGETCIG